MPYEPDEGPIQTVSVDVNYEYNATKLYKQLTEYNEVGVRNLYLAKVELIEASH